MEKNTKEFNKEVGKLIRIIRKNNDLTIQELSDHLSLTRVSLNNIELGVQSLSIYNQNKICSLFKINTDDLTPGKSTIKLVPKEKKLSKFKKMSSLLDAQAEQIKYLEKELKYQKELGYNQLLGELDHIRGVEIPDLEQKEQTALFLLKQLLAFADGGHADPYDIEYARQLLDDRYIEPKREISSDEMPF